MSDPITPPMAPEELERRRAELAAAVAPREARDGQKWQLRRIRALLPAVRPGNLVGPILDPRIGPPLWRLDGLRILTTVQFAAEADDSEWYHVSYSREGALPSHADTCAVRLAMFRHDAVVVQVFPPVAEYVNHNSHVLHLWQRLGKERLVPDLRVEAPWGWSL